MGGNPKSSERSADAAQWYASEMPIHNVYKWLTQVFPSLVESLELRFDGEFVNRWIRMTSESDFRRLLLTMGPDTVHIGSFHTNKKSYMRPLTIDVDLSDTDRACCGKEKRTCPLCWEAIAMHDIPLLHARLLDYFRADEITWVFSGQKGYHCWIHAPQAYMMTADERGTWIDALVVHMATKGSAWVPDRQVTTLLGHTLRLPLTLNKGNVAIPFNPLQIPGLNDLKCTPNQVDRIKGALIYLTLRNAQF